MDVILHLTQDCQLDCVYCYGGQKRERAMSWEVARRAIDLMLDQPCTGTPPQLGFFGGEPLLEWPLLTRCVDHAEARAAEMGRSFRMAITTNGLGVDDAIARYLRGHRVMPTLSFDGVRAAQDACRRYRGGASSFADTQQAMLTLLGYFPDLVVCAVVSPENVRYLPESIDFLLGSGATRLLLNPNFFDTWDDRHLALWREGYEYAARCFERALRSGRFVHVNFITAKIAAHLKGGYELRDCCDFGQKEVAVAPSGNLYPCQRMVGEDTERLGLMGNVFTGFVGDACRCIAKGRQPTNPECLRCDLRRRCRNWCSCVNHRLTGRFDRTGSLVCFHERMAIEIADRAASRLFRDQDKTFLKTFYSEGQISPEWV
ncbi:MAG: radical SAM protein [Armatimonadota bacterium]|nr:MAG: radical SAM protein [Armatimonadota bacterium]